MKKYKNIKVKETIITKVVCNMCRTSFKINNDPNSPYITIQYKGYWDIDNRISQIEIDLCNNCFKNIADKCAIKPKNLNPFVGIFKR